mgnify:CR=1 FL=1
MYYKEYTAYAQWLAGRQARLSRPFLGPTETIFSKVMAENPSNPLNYEKAARSDLRLVRCVQYSPIYAYMLYRVVA